MKAKVEKDKSCGINHEIQDVRTATDAIVISKTSVKKSRYQLKGIIYKMANLLTLGEFESDRSTLKIFLL